MSGRELLRGLDADLGFDPREVAIADEDVLASFEPVMREWWVRQFGQYVPENGGFFTPPQRGAIPLVERGTNTLVCAPTGSGKTQAAFASIVDELYRRERDDGLENSVYCLYISPLKSLANDIHRNLEVPLGEIAEIAAEESNPGVEDEGHDSDGDGDGDGDGIDIRHAIRHGGYRSRRRRRRCRSLRPRHPDSTRRRRSRRSLRGGLRGCGGCRSRAI